MLSELESESIEIIREAMAAAVRPVMLYSIGKNSPVVLRLAQQAFRPVPLPFPLIPGKSDDTGRVFDFIFPQGTPAAL